MADPVNNTSTPVSTVLTRIVLAKIGYSNIFTLTEDNSAWFYESGMQIDADGAYKAYNQNNKLGLDWLANAGHPGNWWALVTDKDGNPVVQGPDDPAPGYYISTTSLEDASKSKDDPRRYVDSSSIPFVVLPSRKTFGAKLGDLCMVYNIARQKLCGGVYADIGPRDKIGECSIAMADALGINSNPKSGGTGNGIVYVVFPGSGVGWPLSNDDIQQNAARVFDKWGGLDRLRVVMPDIHN